MSTRARSARASSHASLPSSHQTRGHARALVPGAAAAETPSTAGAVAFDRHICSREAASGHLELAPALIVAVSGAGEFLGKQGTYCVFTQLQTGGSVYISEEPGGNSLPVTVAQHAQHKPPRGSRAALQPAGPMLHRSERDRRCRLRLLLLQARLLPRMLRLHAWAWAAPGRGYSAPAA